jgi:hypothetical protein
MVHNLYVECFTLSNTCLREVTMVYDQEKQTEYVVGLGQELAASAFTLPSNS